MADYKKPLPVPTPETKPYWDGAKRHELWIMRCNDCSKPYFYPRPICPNCFSRNTDWMQASGKAKLETFVINHRPPPGFEEDAPYVIAVVTLEEGPRMMTNLVGIDPDPTKVKCDMPLEVVFDDVTDEITLPKFKPA
jgi:uncharacterized OB-fold protein